MNHLNPLEGITFPQYRRYKNGKSFFKISSPFSFEEKYFIGSKMKQRQFDVKILPDRNFVMDLLVNYHAFADEISAADYESL